MRKLYAILRTYTFAAPVVFTLLGFILFNPHTTHAQCTTTAQWSSYNLGGDSLRFYASDTNSAAHHIWNWGDGTYTSGVTVTNHHYTQAGTYHVCLYVYIPGTTCSDSLCQNITVALPCTLTAQWSSYSLGGDSVRFYAYDTNSTAHHFWNFGDGTYSTNITSTNHQYATPGTYRVCFYDYIPGTNCSDSLCYNVTVGAVCSANFSYYIMPGTDSVVFYNTSTSNDSIISYSWGFGDGSYGSGRYSGHHYAQAGTYRVCLYIGNTGGCQSYKCDTVVIPAGNCGVASFTDSLISISQVFVQSTSSVSGNLNAYAWYVDGVRIISPNPNTAATLNIAPGHHKICLYLYNNNNLCDSACQYVSMPCQLNAAWSYTVLGGDSIHFYGQDTSSVNHHDWSFGDGTYSATNSHSPTHVYSQPGTYHVCLFVYVAGCVDSFCQTVVVTGTRACPVTANWFSYSLGGDSLRFYTPDTTSAAHHIWNWGDGTITSGTTYTNHTFPGPGTYHVCLYVYIPGTTCADSMCNNVVIGAQPCNITAQWSHYSLGGDSVRFYAYDTSSIAHFYWNWGDGSNYGSGRYETHTFPGPGTYHVCLYMYIPGTNCGDSLCQNITITGGAPCNIRWGWRYTISGDSVTFSAEDTVNAAHHIFNFGDGTYSANNTHPTHVYSQPGTYHVCFYVYIPGTTCSDSFCQSITILAATTCHISAYWSSYNLSGDTVRFYSSDTNSTAHHIWVWGDGTFTSGVTVTNHHYPQPGTYHVCYYVYIPGTNCSDSLCNNVTVGNNTGGYGQGCQITAAWTSYNVGGDSIHFFAYDTNSTAHHIWIFGDGTYAAATINPTHVYTQPGTYHVCLYVYVPGTNCADSLCSSVTIAPPATPPCTITANWVSYSLNGDSVRFYARDTNTAAHHIWVWGDGTYTSGTTAATHVFPAAGTYHVCLYVYVPGTNCSDSLCDNIVVGGNPCHINIQWAAYSVGGDSVRFYSYDTNSAAHHIWVWGDGTYTSGQTRATHVYADTGTYHVCYYVYIPGTSCIDSFCRDIDLSANGHLRLSANWVSIPLGGDTVGFVATAPDSTGAIYEIWSFGDGTYAFNTNNPSHTYATSGTYVVCLYMFIPGTDLADTVCQTINVVLGINEVTDPNIRIIAMPNPFNQSVQIIARGLNGNFDLKLYDVVGRQVNFAGNINGSYTLKRGSLAAGMYVYEVIQNGKVIGTGKVVAQ